MTRSGFSGVPLVGLALIVLGAMFLLENSGLLGSDPNLVATYWPFLLIGLGLWGLFDGGFRFRLFPTILTGLGTAFLLSNLGLWTWAGNLLWPAVLIVVGLGLLSRRVYFPRRRRRDSSESVGAAQAKD